MKIKTWSYGINSYFKTATIFVREMPLWLHLLDTINDRVCGYIPAIPFPDILPKKRNTLKDCVCYTNGKNDYCKSHEHLYTLKEWYGDLRSWWHGLVCFPIFHYCNNHKSYKQYSFEVPYDKVREYFYEDNKEFFDEMENL